MSNYVNITPTKVNVRNKFPYIYIREPSYILTSATFICRKQKTGARSHDGCTMLVIIIQNRSPHTALPLLTMAVFAVELSVEAKVTPKCWERELLIHRYAI